MSNSLLDRFENKLKDAVVQGALAILVMLVRPIATLTEVFFRKNMGERYFTMSCTVGGFLLIWTFCTPYGHIIESMTQTSSREFFGGPRPHGVVWSGHDLVLLGILITWSIALALLHRFHELEVRERYNKETRWHSGNCGLQRIPMPYALEKGLPIAAGLITIILGAWGPGILLIASGLTSLALRAHETQQFYGRMLDIIDGQIEQEHMAKAIQERLSPDKVDGLQAPLPAYVSSKYRELIAQASRPPQATSTEPAIS